jgi:superoxide dismutase
MPLALPPLRYPYGALEPTIDELTMRIHHDKHRQATAKTHVSRAMLKLGVHDRAQLVVFAVHAGLAIPRAEVAAAHALVLGRAS